MAELESIYGRGVVPSKLENVHTSDLQGIFLGKKVRMGSGRETLGVVEFDLHEETSVREGSSLGETKAVMRADARQREKKAQMSILRQLPDLRPGAFQRFLTVMRRVRQSRSYGALKDEAETLFPEVSHRHAVLTEAASVADENGGDAELANLFRQWADELMEEQEAPIRASYNVSEVALSELGGNTEGLQDARDFYRRAVFSFQVPGESYRFIVEESPPVVTGKNSISITEETPAEASFLANKLDRVLGFLRRCLDADLKSLTPSQDPVFLKSVIDGLYYVEFLGNAHKSGLQLLEKFHDHYDAGIRVKPYRLMCGILDAMPQEYVAPDYFLNLAWEVRVPPLETTINFLTQLCDLVREMPLKVYPQAESREILLQAIQLSLDLVIEEEQKALGEKAP